METTEWVQGGRSYMEKPISREEEIQVRRLLKDLPDHLCGRVCWKFLQYPELKSQVEQYQKERREQNMQSFGDALRKIADTADDRGY